MLRIRECVLSRILHSAYPPFISLHRLLSAATAPVPPKPAGFVSEDYLVATYGLTRPQALKVSATLVSRLKSPSKPDAVLAFLRGIGLSNADVSALIVKDPLFLCAGVERTLAPIVVELAAFGLSTSEIARLIPLAHCRFRSRSIVSKLQYFLPFFGSFENLLRVLKFRHSLLSRSLDNVIKPNVALLRECGLDDRAIVHLLFREPNLFIRKPEHILTMVTCAKDLGVPLDSGMFPIALVAVEFCGSEKKVAAKVECLKKTFRWSDAQVRTAVCKSPNLLRTSKEMTQRRSEFLLSEVGLEPAYIACRPAMLCLSLDGRLKARYYVQNFLKANGLGRCHRSYNTTFCMSERMFLEKVIHPHNEAAPHLAEDYAAACRGEVPSRLRITQGMKNML